MSTNSYQKSKARKIARVLLSAQADSTVRPTQLRRLVAHMDADQWRVVSFAAGVPCADLAAKQAVLEMLP